MLPLNELSTSVKYANFLDPDAFIPTFTKDYELGGIALRDPTQGLEVQVWTCEVQGNNVILYAENVEPTIAFTRSGVTEVSLAFDQNMNPFIAFVENGDAKFWWYDTVAVAQVFTNLTGGVSPRAALDDKRKLQTGRSDIILGYVKDNDLCMRVQRDRFTIEYVLKTEVDAIIRRMGMNRGNRFQFEMTPIGVFK